jgi:hypothetical protein
VSWPERHPSGRRSLRETSPTFMKKGPHAQDPSAVLSGDCDAITIETQRPLRGPHSAFAAAALARHR